MLIHDYAAMLKDFMKRHSPIAIVCDAGALGKDIVEQLRQVYEIPIIAADKKHKPANIAFLNSDIKKERVRFLPEAKPLYQQMRLLQWADKYQLKEDDAFRNDIADAGLYIHRYATNVYKPDRIDDAPAPGTREHLEAQAAKSKAAALRRVRMSKDEGYQDNEFSALIGRN